ncbi:inorganic phosphate transporter [Nocardioides sp. Iso805N]|uniref:inorganic phosphate transporter n=1 Tax=Nocardioides sp. Iso805N TaxID=1283287 RepID=UPI00036881C5|nr:inorganic phosphate transporter [Nocardioides sp. Iso805N]
MSAETLTLVLVVVTALGFDFTNGFHDTGNAMATSIATGALKPRVAVAISAVMNLVGAFLSVSVALTVTNAVVKTFDSSATSATDALTVPGDVLLAIVLAGLIGGIVWNMLTWLLGLPSSSSHALFGGLIGATIASLGWNGVNWVGDGTQPDGVVGKILLPAVASPLVAGLVAGTGTWLIYRIIVGVAARFTESGFRWGQVGTASLVSLAHGTNDAQKTMGVITLALIATGRWTSLTSIPFWVKLSCAVAIAAGTYIGGWRIIRTLGKGLVEIESPQGVAAESASAAVILASSHLGFALSTTHVATGSILGTGLGKPGAEVRWGVAGRMGVGWLLTLPAAAIVGAAMWGLGNLFGLAVGSIVEFAVLAVVAGYLFTRSRRTPVGAHNVNDEWESTTASPNTPTGAAV